MARHCPECGVEWNGNQCQACSYTSSYRDPDWWRCCHEDRGQRCANAGSVSHSTHGTTKGARHVSGPWFCPLHVPAMQRYADAFACPPPMGFTALRIKARGQVRVFDFEAEAERIAMQTEPAT